MFNLNKLGKKKRGDKDLSRSEIRSLKAADRAAGIPTSRRQLSPAEKTQADMLRARDEMINRLSGVPATKKGGRAIRRSARF